MNNKVMKKAKEVLKKHKTTPFKGEYRLNYHIMPSQGLLNDPNGFIEYDGKYHLFYQWNPFECTHGSKLWGHYISDDLTTWTEITPGLAPDEYYEKNGCYSGSAIEHHGEMYLFYTGNVKHDNGNRDSYQCLAKSKDGIDFEKIGPVIKEPPVGYTKHFRDPKVWKKEDKWYMVIGAQTLDLQGRVLLYTSENLINWKFNGEIAGNGINGLKGFGYMWECPDLFNLNGFDVLLSSPQGIEAQGDLYNNIYQSGYLLGRYDYDKNNYIHGEFVELDRGFEFYAPQTTLDSKGRRLMFAWMGLPEEEDHPTLEEGWIHAMTLPRELKVIDGKLYQKPLKELQNLRKNVVLYSERLITTEVELDQISGDSYELIIDMKDINGNSGLKLRTSKEEETLIYLDIETSKVVLDRNRSGKGYKGIRRCKVEGISNLKLHIFMDKSSIEIFVNDGKEVFTSRIYPSKESTGIKFFTDGSYKANIKKYDL